MPALNGLASADTLTPVVDWGETRTALPSPDPERDPLAPFLDLLGAVPDAEIAALAGVTATRVRRARLARQRLAGGDRPHLPTRLDPRTVARWHAAHAETVWAYRVLLDDGELLVLARDPLVAARIASEAGAEGITSVEPLARVL